MLSGSIWCPQYFLLAHSVCFTVSPLQWWTDRDYGKYSWEVLWWTCNWFSVFLRVVGPMVWWERMLKLLCGLGWHTFSLFSHSFALSFLGMSFRCSSRFAILHFLHHIVPGFSSWVEPVQKVTQSHAPKRGICDFLLQKFYAGRKSTLNIISSAQNCPKILR